MSVDRRTFLKGATLASAMALAPGSADGATAGRGNGRVWHRAPCRFCGVGCGLLIAVENGRAVALKGDLESPVSHGLACVKGYHAIQTLYARDRITRPLVRRNGVLVETSLAAAYDVIAARLRDSIAQHGSDSVGMYGSGHWSVTDAYIANKLCKGALGTANIDSSARLYSGAARSGLATTYGFDGAPGSYEDIDHADVFVLWGYNMAECDPVLFSRVLERRRTNPAVQIIDLGTRTTRTSYAADRALLYAPHSEIAVANAICHEIVARRGVNRDFVERHVAFARGSVAPGYGTDELVLSDDVVRGVTFRDFSRFLETYTPEHVAVTAALAAADIKWLASVYADRSRNVLSLWGSELNRHVRGTWVNNALHNIHLLVGKVGAPGNGTLCGTAQPSGADAVTDAGASPAGLPRGSVRNAADREFAAHIWGVAAERIPVRPGRSAVSLFRGLESGAIRFLWVQASNPLTSLPNAQRYRTAMAAGRAFVVVTEAYHTSTTAAADVVLPAALWLEREGAFGNAERRVQHFGSMVPAPAAARADGWHMIEVARRLGHTDLFPWSAETCAAEAWNELARFNAHMTNRQPPIAELRAGPGTIWPYVAGRETKWRYHTELDPAADPQRGTFDFYGYADHRARIWLRPHEPPAEAPDREYPFWLVTGQVIEHAGTGTLTRRIPALQRAVPRAFAELNRDDARELGIRNGSIVRLVTRRGSVQLEARVEHRTQVPRGMAFVPTFDEASPVNLVTHDACCPLSGQPDGKCAVRVERVG
jgi:nitrate reductase (cytochrome)